MCAPSRRSFFTLIAALVSPRAFALEAKHEPFVRAAFDMRIQAISTGDQPFGAVVVRNSEIVGYGPSRVVIKKDQTAHAEREAMRDAQARLGRSDLSGCVMYSTSRPCAACERYAAQAKLSRMFYGPEAEDAGSPR